MNEITFLRTKTSKTFDAGNNKRLSKCYSTPIHFWSPQGKGTNPNVDEWEDIDINFNDISNKYICDKNNVITEIKGDKSTTDGIVLKFSENQILKISLLKVEYDGIDLLNGTSFNNLSKEEKNSFICTFISGDGQIEYKQTKNRFSIFAKANKLIEDFSIEFEFSLTGISCSNNKNIIGGEIHYITDNNGVFNFVDKDDNFVFRIKSPFFIDSANNISNNIIHTLYESNGKLYYTKVPSNDGKNDLYLAIYPIYIDITITSDTSDGRVFLCEQESWEDVHDTLVGSSVDTTGTVFTFGILSFLNKVDDYCLYRAFFSFDTSSIGGSSTITSAILYIKGSLDNSETHTAMCQKGTHGDSLVVGDYDSFTGNLYGQFNLNSGDGDGVWNSDDWNLCDLDGSTDLPGGDSGSNGYDDIEKTGTTRICVREYTYDYKDSDPGAPANEYFNIYSAEEDGSEPYLSIEYTTSTAIPPTELYIEVGEY